MAEFLDQDQIHALLNEHITGEGDDSGSDSESGQKKSKYFKKPPKPPFRYSRKKPITPIKEGTYILNPEPEKIYDSDLAQGPSNIATILRESVTDNKPTVWSLNNYTKHVKFVREYKRNQQV